MCNEATGSDDFVQCYAKALDSLGGSIVQTTSEAGVLLWIKCSLNLACCHLRLGQFKQCVALCDSLLEVDPANIVALCHRGRALLMVQQHAAAKADLTEALELLEEEAAEQVQQQQSYLGQQQPNGSDGHGAAGPLLAAGERTGGGAIRPSSRCLSPCTLARMRLNNSYWQQRVVELLASTSKADPAAK
ncbi:hypothetical protein OEZ86_010039 [Tetradesmus obliquus]|uniref:Peptidylprolyl isomerase n=1 Tax=Tetradesmus obliquus TaxID=3088 RepID=A0ABY8UNX7_TETOB|nr:hypothetical protein OEZ85_001474 [Tetradesmus obliquus]WIA43592.1 hypothetical protein OEZ86_010039 [Tetradesmus obliquus]